jgi:hypothetical protein
MDAIGLGLLVMLVGSLALALWRRRRQERLEVTHHRLRCPMHGECADVTVASDPLARSGAQHVAVTGCSLLPDAAVGLPERVAYLWDGPPVPVRVAPPRFSPLYTGEVACRQPCLAMLNASAVPGAMRPLRCSSGASDAVALMEQAIGTGRMSRLLLYASL